MKYAAVFAFLAYTGCAIRQLAAWHLVQQGTGQILIPPDVTRKNLARRTFATEAAESGSCPAASGVIDVTRRGTASPWSMQSAATRNA
jgi:hypothetical protein